MSVIRRTLTRSTLPLLLVFCLATLSVSYAFADEAQRPLATQVIGDPDAAVAGKFAVGTATPGNKALTVVGVIDFLGSGTVHNYFTQGTGNNMQINTNVDETNTVGDAAKSQWKLVMGSSLDWFSIRRSPASGTYNEDALFFIQGITGNVGIAKVDTDNGAAIPFTPMAKLHVQNAVGDAVWGVASGWGIGVYGQSNTPGGTGVKGEGATGVFGSGGLGVAGRSDVPGGVGVSGASDATTDNFPDINTGVYGFAQSYYGTGVFGRACTDIGEGMGVLGWSDSVSGYAVYGYAAATTGTNYGVFGQSNSTSGYGVYSYGNMAVLGDFSATGTKAALVETKDYGWRNLYAMESPQNWFEDFGQATLTAGEAIVPIEEIFAQTVNLDDGYHVFLTPLGQCGLYVAEKSGTAFTVRTLDGSACEISFDYRIIAPRLDYEDLRLKEAENPQAVAASIPEVR